MKMIHNSTRTLAPTGILALLALLSSAANATTVSSNFTVQATVLTNCTISATTLSFGTYNPLSATDNTASGTVTIACTKGAATTIGMGNGLNFAATRNMKSGAGELISYTLGQPPTNAVGSVCTFPPATTWTGASLFTPAVAPSKAARTYNVCGTATAGQDVTGSVAGVSYTDTVSASVNF